MKSYSPSGEGRGTSGAKSNRLNPYNVRDKKKNNLWLLRYNQNINKYRNGIEPEYIECQGLYIGGKSHALCIAKDLNDGGKCSVEKLEVSLKTNKDQLICKTLF